MADAVKADRAKVLILGGTAEAAALAQRLDTDPRMSVTTSLAGRTRDPAPLAGEVRIGGFGGPEGLGAYLRRHGTRLLIDATHPFAEQITQHAAEACEATGVARLRLVRPPWERREGDDWREAADLPAAVGLVATLGRRVFLTIGRQELSAFAGLTGHHFLVRTIDPPEAPSPLRDCQVVLGRGPFAEDDEAALLQRHRIDLLVAKNSGGLATYGKIAAARRLGLPVVMIERPVEPPSKSVATLGAALIWADAWLAAPRNTAPS